MTQPLECHFPLAGSSELFECYIKACRGHLPDYPNIQESQQAADSHHGDHNIGGGSPHFGILVICHFLSPGLVSLKRLALFQLFGISEGKFKFLAISTKY